MRKAVMCGVAVAFVASAPAPAQERPPVPPAPLLQEQSSPELVQLQLQSEEPAPTAPRALANVPLNAPSRSSARLVDKPPTKQHVRPQPKVQIAARSLALPPGK